MTTANRFGKRWTINECLQLQREYELLRLSIDEIATRHQRTPNAIMFKLSEEKFADYNTLYNKYHNLNFVAQPNSVDDKYDHSEDVEEEEEEGDADDSSTYRDDVDSNDDNSSVVSEDETSCLRTRVNTLEKKIDELTQIILSQSKTKQSSGVSSWFS